MMEGMELQNQEKIKMNGEKETYKYLEISETKTIKHLKMKGKNYKRATQEKEKATRNQTI